MIVVLGPTIGRTGTIVRKAAGRCGTGDGEIRVPSTAMYA
jgi:hypothetical protein